MIDHGRFKHEALLYAGHDDFLRHTVAFVRDGLASDEPVLVVVQPKKLTVLREALGGDADAVRFEDMSEVGRNPARLIPLWQRFVAEHSSSGRPLRGIGEPVWAGRSPAELSECARHEELLNLAFEDPSFFLLCPYDLTSLDLEVIERARRNHPMLWDRHGEGRSPAFSSGPVMGSGVTDALPEPPKEAASLSFGALDLSHVRRVVRHGTRAVEMSDDQRTDLVTAVNEVATNSIRHGGGGGHLRVWQEIDRVVCEVRDKGRIDDPLADRRLPVTRSARGYGLWISNQLCDLVQLRSTPGGCVVRLHKRFGAASRASSTARAHGPTGY